jgi:hypothetical protein
MGNLNQDCHGTSSIQREKYSFHQQLGLKFKEETCEMMYLELCMELKL